MPPPPPLPPDHLGFVSAPEEHLAWSERCSLPQRLGSGLEKAHHRADAGPRAHLHPFPNLRSAGVPQ